LTALKQQKLESSTLLRPRSCSLPWPSGVPHNWRRQSHAQPKRNGGKQRPRRRVPQPRQLPWANQAVPSNPALSNECTLAHGARSHTDTSPIPRSDQCRRTGSFVAGSSSNRKTAAAAASSQQLKERAQERAHDAMVPLLVRAVASAEAAQRAASQHTQQLVAVRPTAEKGA
jgi:hypothetical protein